MTLLLHAGVALLAALGLGFGWLLAFGGRPAYHPYTSLDECLLALQQLAALMQPGASYIIEREDPAFCVEFVRETDGVRFALPEDGWASAHLERIASALGAAGLLAEAARGDSGGARALTVLLRGTPDEVSAAATQVAHLVAAAAGVPVRGRFRGHYERAEYDPTAYLAHWGPLFEQQARTGPRPAREFFRRHLRTLRRAAGQAD